MLMINGGGIVKHGQQIMLYLLDLATPTTESNVDALAAMLGIKTEMVAEDALCKIVESMKASHPAEIAAYQNGTKPRVKRWLIGQVMKKTKGAASPNAIEDLIDHIYPVQPK